MDRFDISVKILQACLPISRLEGKQAGERVSIVIEEVRRIYERISQIERDSNFLNENNQESIEHSKFHREKISKLLEILQVHEALENLDLEAKVNKLLGLYTLLCAQFFIDRIMGENQSNTVPSLSIESPDQLTEIINNPENFRPSGIPSMIDMVCDDPDC